eukprot:GILI01009974.1.p1 GENE.GILI01009974.1~~GILI01009974.1.p1  ORF type:complete len:654 (+),score=210.47 GILI01009974.1:98-2059(+)
MSSRPSASGVPPSAPLVPPSYGQKLKEGEVDGLKAQRRCTDVLVLLLFIALCTGMVFVARYAFTNGEARKLGRGIDYQGRICGVDNGVQDKPYLFWPRVKYDLSVCLKECPTYDFSGNSTSLPGGGGGIFVPDVNNNQVFFPFYNTLPVLRSFCVPINNTKAEQAQKLFSNAQRLATDFSDISKGWGTILGSAFIALALGFLFLVLLKFFTPCLTWTVILGTMGLLALCGGLMIQTYTNIIQGKLAYTRTKPELLLAIGIPAIICSVFIFYVACRYRKSIQEATKMVQVTTRAMFSMPLLVFQPFVCFCIVSLYVAYWISTLLYLVTCFDVIDDAVTIDGRIFKVRTAEADVNTGFMIFIHVVGLFWITEFIFGFFHFVFSGAIVSWYFTKPSPNGQRLPVQPILTPMFYGLFFHLGSLAYGSLTITPFRFLRFFVGNCLSVYRVMGGRNSSVAKVMCCCIFYCESCFDNFLRYLDKQAYVMLALTGKNFLDSAEDSYNLLQRNEERVSVLNKVAGPFFLLGKAFVGLGAGGFSFLILSHDPIYLPGGDLELTSPFVPAVCCLLVGLVVGMTFMDVIDMATQTVLQCFCADFEMSRDGNLTHTPDELQEFMEKRAIKAQAQVKPVPTPSTVPAAPAKAAAGTGKVPPPPPNRK